MSQPSWAPYHVNCLWDSLQAVCAYRGYSETQVAHLLVQPLDFGFEIELATRDWWLGGSSGVFFQRPTFHAGLTATWEIHDGDSFAKTVRAAAPTRHSPMLFQTEWSLVPYSPHFGWNRGDIHVASVLTVESNGETVLVRDRMHTAVVDIDDTHYGVVPIGHYEEATRKRFRVLRWAVDENRMACDVEGLLRTSVAQMTGFVDDFAVGPHAHISTGLHGIRYFADVVGAYAPQFTGDAHFRHLLAVRLVDSTLTVIGDRLILGVVLRGGGRGDGYPKTAAALADAIGAWKRLTLALRRVSQLPEVNLALLSRSILNVAEAEERLVAAMDAEAQA